jgi:hypothetical protein
VLIAGPWRLDGGGRGDLPVTEVFRVVMSGIVPVRMGRRTRRPAALELHMTAPPAGPHDADWGSAVGRACYDRATALALPKLRFLKSLSGRSEAADSLRHSCIGHGHICRAVRMSDRLLGLICVVLLLAVVLFGGEAHAQPIDWSSYQLGRSQSSYYQGTAPNGEHWTGQSHTSGHTTYFGAYGPNGQAKHCSSYKLGLSAYTDCPVPFPASAMAASLGANSAKHGRTSVHRVAAAVPADRH